MHNRNQTESLPLVIIVTTISATGVGTRTRLRGTRQHVITVACILGRTVVRESGCVPTTKDVDKETIG